jgi:flagellar L-ring protein precursor FlgH
MFTQFRPRVRVAPRKPRDHQRTRPQSTALALAGLTAASLLLSGCNMLSRLSEVGSAPDLSKIENPAVYHGGQPVAVPMPQPVSLDHQANSLWRPGSRAFFKDQRASDVGDILTVVIDIDDSAALSNSSERERASGESAGLGAFLGFDQQLGQFLPDEIDNENLVDANSDSLSRGSGSIDREESINVEVAAMVTQVLPNGNLVIAGRQETRVNYELRQLQVTGIVRPEDITATNQVAFQQIAEARISYGGRGHISDVQQPRYGQQIYDILFPW